LTIKAVRGTRDLLPPETELWNRLEQTAREIFALYNFSEIRTPIFEDTQLFARGVGEATDIVSKEMYTWEDRARAQSEKAQSLTLRPENTAGVVRAYIEHKLWERPGLQKLYYIGAQFRRERPQKGRYRQFYQIGAEVIGPPSAGSESPIRDAEVLEMLVMLLNRLEIKDWTLQLNSVGSPSSRTAFEFTQGSLGAQNAILGGGRYDGLSEALGGPPAPGVGFAIGEDRFVMALAAGQENLSAISAPQAYIAPLGEGMNVPSAKLAWELRSAGVRVELGDESFRLKKSFETAEKLGIAKVVIVGESEVASNNYAVRDLENGEQDHMSKSQLASNIVPFVRKKGPNQSNDQLDELLRRAILERRLIQFDYQSKSRIAEPHDYGIQKGRERLLAYQIRGASTGKLPGWRWIDIAGISNLEILTEKFAGSRSDESTKHHKWERVIVRVG
jgi:histidyl-tRNA synthetase